MITKKQRENNKLRLEINEELRDWPNSIGESDGENYFRGFFLLDSHLFTS